MMKIRRTAFDETSPGTGTWDVALLRASSGRLLQINRIHRFLQLTGYPSADMGIAHSREVNRQGQRNLSILVIKQSDTFYTYLSGPRITIDIYS